MTSSSTVPANCGAATCRATGCSGSIPQSGKSVEYLLPRPTNIRRIFVDNTTNPVTFWAGNNHGAEIIKLEPLE